MSKVKVTMTKIASPITERIINENGGEFVFHEYAVPSEFFSGEKCCILFSVSGQEKYTVPENEIFIEFLD